MDAAARAAQIDRILADLVADVDVAAAAFVTDDGLLLASALPAHAEPLMGEPTARWLVRSVQIARGLGLGDLREITLRGEVGHAMFLRAGAGQVLVACMPADATLALATLNARHAAHALAKLG